MDNESYVQPVADKKGMALASFILGVVGIITWLIPIIGLAVTITGFVFGIKGLKSSRRVLAIIGIILCVIFFLVSIGCVILSVYAALLAIS